MEKGECGKLGIELRLDSDVVLAWFPSQDESFLGISADPLTRGDACLILRSYLRGLLSNFSGFSE